MSGYRSIIACLFALIYRYMPARRVRWRTVISGGILTAVLFDVGRWGIGLYLAHSTEPSAFGAAASFAALLLWLYYTAQIFLFGAEFTACLAGGREENAQGRPRLGRLQPLQANNSKITSQIGAQTDGKAQADLETAT